MWDIIILHNNHGIYKMKDLAKINNTKVKKNLLNNNNHLSYDLFGLSSK